MLEWGVNFDTAFERFSKLIGKKELISDFSLIIEARKLGASTSNVFLEVSKKLEQSNEIEKQKDIDMSINTGVGYFSFIIFLTILFILYNQLFLSFLSDPSSATQINAEEFDLKLSVILSLFIILSYELAFLSGIVFGFMKEFDLFSGSKHIFILCMLTFLGFLIFT